MCKNKIALHLIKLATVRVNTEKMSVSSSQIGPLWTNDIAMLMTLLQVHYFAQTNKPKHTLQQNFDSLPLSSRG